MKGIILAAGLGKRLGRLTRILPKPLLPIAGIPVIQLNIEKMRAAGIAQIGINLYYKSELIKNFLQKFQNLKVITEASLSGTGGALLHFRNFVSNDFLVHNCDVISNIDLEKVIRVHKEKKPLGTIVLVKNYKTSRVRISKNRIIKFYKKRIDNCFTYTGIAVLSKKIFDYFPEGKKIFSLTEVYNQAIKNNELLYGFIVNDLWFDIGTSSVYWSLNEAILTKKIKINGIGL